MKHNGWAPERVCNGEDRVRVRVEGGGLAQDGVFSGVSTGWFCWGFTGVLSTMPDPLPCAVGGTGSKQCHKGTLMATAGGEGGRGRAGG